MYVTKPNTDTEKQLLSEWAYISRIYYDGILVGYRLYKTGYYRLPHFVRYHWL